MRTLWLFNCNFVRNSTISFGSVKAHIYKVFWGQLQSPESRVELFTVYISLSKFTTWSTFINYDPHHNSMQQSLVVPMQWRMISKSWNKCGQEEQLTHEKSTVITRKMEVNAENTANTVEARSVSWLAHSTEEWKKKLAKLWYEKNCGYFVVRSVEFRPNGGLTLVKMCKKIVIHGCREVLIAFCALYFLWGFYEIFWVNNKFPEIEKQIFTPTVEM